MRQIMKKARAASQTETSSSDSDEIDGTYQRFLDDVQAGTDVSLMTEVPTADGVSNSTLPVLNLAPTDKSTSATSGIRGRRKMKRGQLTGFAIMGLSIVVLAIVIAVMMSGEPNSPTSVSNPVATDTSANVPVPDLQATFAAIPDLKAVAGETFTFQPTIESDANLASMQNLVYELSPSTPHGISVDSKTGEINWPVGRTHSPGTITAGLLLFKEGRDNKTEVASIDIPIEIVLGTASVELQEFLPRRLVPGQLFDAQVKTNLDEESRRQIGVRFQPGEDSPQGLAVDPVSGRLTWTPTAAQAGRHQFTVAIISSSDGGDSRELDRTTIDLSVIAPVMTLRLPDFPRQSAQAGTQFEFPLNIPNRRQLLRLVDIKPGPAAPEGVQVDVEARLVRWQIPSDVAGVVRIPLVATPKLPELRTSPTSRMETILIVDVSESSSPGANLPDRNETDAALAEHRETYRSSIAAARNGTLRTALAARLMLQSYDLESGAAHLALLELIEEIGMRARAYDILFEVGRERATRYSIDELKSVTGIMDSFRRTGLSAVQRDLILEHALRLSSQSASGTDDQALNVTTELVGFALQQIRGTDADPALLSDLEQAEDLCKVLATESDSANRKLKQSELTRLLARWQFADTFRQPDQLQFVQAASQGTALPNGGRSLWTIEEGRVHLESNVESAIVGIVQPGDLTSAFVLRFSLLPTSNTAQILLANGDANSPDFQAVRISLASTNPGQIINLTTNAVIAQPTSNAAASFVQDRENHVELVVNSDSVSLSVNGIQIQQTALPDVSGVRLGIGADLRQPQPKLRIRNIRILKLPN